MLARSSAHSGVCAKPQQARVQSRALAARPIASRSRQVVCQGLFGLGLPELAVIAGVAALIFGPSKLPELGKSMGKTVKSFQTAASEFNDELKAGMAGDEAAKKPAAEEPKKDGN